jgi:3-deoxy-D-manno-octulosonic acid (KDO) 8-phosphate synthase
MLLSYVVSLIVDLAIKNMQVMSNSAEKVRLAGNPNVMVCERGTMFGYSKCARFLSQMMHAICF